MIYPADFYYLDLDCGDESIHSQAIKRIIETSAWEQVQLSINLRNHLDFDLKVRRGPTPIRFTLCEFRRSQEAREFSSGVFRNCLCLN